MAVAYWNSKKAEIIRHFSDPSNLNFINENWNYTPGMQEKIVTSGPQTAEEFFNWVAADYERVQRAFLHMMIYQQLIPPGMDQINYYYSMPTERMKPQIYSSNNSNGNTINIGCAIYKSK